MSDTAPTNISVHAADQTHVRTTLSQLVIAWANDALTGKPRYIGEIDAEHRGARCGCICPSCNLPLTAVNAARTTFKRRPHFRHPEGTQRTECVILAARHAALRMLTQNEMIELPARAIRGTAQGLSGKTYEAWITAPVRTVRIADVRFEDHAIALLRLDDGQELRVLLTGDIRLDEGGHRNRILPTIRINVDEKLAGLDPHSILHRLKLLPDAICWVAHSQDASCKHKPVGPRQTRLMRHWIG